MNPKQQLATALFIFVMLIGAVITLIVNVKNANYDEIPIVEYETVSFRNKVKNQEPEPPANVVQEALVQFAEACKYDAIDQKVRCDYAKLNDVLKQRSRYPDFIKYSNPTDGIYFTYPSSVARVKKTFDGEIVSILVAPINSEFVNTEFWKGIIINLENCNDQCPSDLRNYLTELYPPTIEVIQNGTTTATTTKDIITFSTKEHKFASKDWTVGEVEREGQSTFRVLVAVFGKRLVEIYDDTYLQGIDIENAFSEVFNTLMIN
ncbi:hypothetical protein H6775_01305 [Candidatus Nomurabacteria bacterium]|nr:hypothetical protein [Candidatus Nomurabacteria bacterium]